MRWDGNIRAEAPLEQRSLWRAMRLGWRRRCPSCGAGPLFQGYVKVRRACVSCGESLHHHRADDLPAYMTILVVGKLIIAGLIGIEFAVSPPVWVHWGLWPALTVLLSLWLLPRIKGAIVGMQWALGMHGFGDRE